MNKFGKYWLYIYFGEPEKKHYELFSNFVHNPYFLLLSEWFNFEKKYCLFNDFLIF